MKILMVVVGVVVFSAILSLVGVCVLKHATDILD